MSTPLTDSINALTAYANETTGASDTTLSDAVGRLCEGFGKPELWKTVTLDNNHTSSNQANPIYWQSFFGISEQDILDGYIYLVIPTNNIGYLRKHDAFHVGVGIYFRDVLEDGAPFVNAVFARTPFNSGATYRENYYAFATKGTVFTIYRFKLS